jgi:hypothetical protein
MSTVSPSRRLAELFADRLDRDVDDADVELHHREAEAGGEQGQGSMSRLLLVPTLPATGFGPRQARHPRSPRP